MEPTCLPPSSGLGEPRGVRLVFRAAGFKKKRKKGIIYFSENILEICILLRSAPNLVKQILLVLF
jgi:hypothetical protein